jgi:hypothetical protein
VSLSPDVLGGPWRDCRRCHAEIYAPDAWSLNRGPFAFDYGLWAALFVLCVVNRYDTSTTKRAVTGMYTKRIGTYTKCVRLPRTHAGEPPVHMVQLVYNTIYSNNLNKCTSKNIH